MTEKPVLSIFVITGYLLSLLFYWTPIGGNLNQTFKIILYLIPPLLAVLGGYYALGSYGIKGPKGTSLLLISSGLLAWFIGEILFDYYEFFTATTPYPSLADIFYIIGYPLILGGIFYELKKSGVSLSKISKPMLFCLGLIALLLTVIVLYFGVYSAYKPESPLLNNAFVISYGVGDLIILLATLAILLLVWEYKGGKLSLPWIYIFFGFASTLLADILFAIYTSQYDEGSYLIVNILDNFWILGYYLIGFGLFKSGFLIDQVKKKAALKVS